MKGFQLSAAVGTVFLAIAGLAFSQASPAPPLSKAKVVQVFQFEKTSSQLKGTTKSQVEQDGVDFELDAKTEQEFRNAGMDQELLNTIRKQLKAGKIEVRCEPVECEVSINNVPAGATVDSVLTKSPVM